MRNLKEAFSQVGLELKQESVKCRVCSAEKVQKKNGVLTDFFMEQMF